MIVHGMTSEPGMVSGETGFDTVFMSGMAGAAISKGGAEGCQAVGLAGKGIGLGQDNNINERLYGLKGRDVLLRKTISSASIPPRISEFQQALEKYYSR